MEMSMVSRFGKWYTITLGVPYLNQITQGYHNNLRSNEFNHQKLVFPTQTQKE